MIGIVMAGGKGSRMHLPTEKLMLEYKKPVILHVIDALKESKCFSNIVAMVSPNSPNTKSLLQQNKIDLIDSSGQGYVQDLNQILQSRNDSVFITSGDLPLLDGEIIRKIVKGHDPASIWTSVLVAKEFLVSLQVSIGHEITFNNQPYCYTGISLVNAQKINSVKKVPENYIILNDKRIAFNLNTKADYELLGTT